MNPLVIVLAIFFIFTFLLATLYKNFINRNIYLLNDDNIKIYTIFPPNSYKIPLNKIKGFFDPQSINFNIWENEEKGQALYEKYSVRMLGNMFLGSISIWIIHENGDKKKVLTMLTPGRRLHFIKQLKELGIQEKNIFKGIKNETVDLRIPCKKEIHKISLKGDLFRNTQASNTVFLFSGILIVEHLYFIYLALGFTTWSEMGAAIVTSLGSILFCQYFIRFIIYDTPYWIKISPSTLSLYFKMNKGRDLTIYKSEIYQIAFKKNNQVEILSHDTRSLKIRLSIELRRELKKFAQNNKIKIASEGKN